MQAGACRHLPVSPPLNPSAFPSSFLPNSHLSFSKDGNFPLFVPRFLSARRSSPYPRRTHVLFSSPEGAAADGGASSESYARESELELLGKPSPIFIPDEEEEEEEDAGASSTSMAMEDALAPFLKFFTARDSVEGAVAKGEAARITGEYAEGKVEEQRKEQAQKVLVDYYEPKPGDFVVGVVVSGNEHKLDVNVGADLLGTMLTKEVLPLYGGEMAHTLCELGVDEQEFMVPGKIGILKEEEALDGEAAPGRPVVDVGYVLFAEVLGRTLSGRPLLSTRRMFRRAAWHRVRQIKQLGEPIDVRITEWNTGGLITRIEGLRAFLPKAELMNRVNNFRELKENVGRHISVCINRIDEEKNSLIISEREAWDVRHLREGTLLEGTVRKIFPFGAQVRIGDTNRSGLLHISNISRARVESVGSLLEVDEKVKVLVVKSMFPDKISLSIADLESEPGLFLSNKEKVFSEAEEMAKRYNRLRAPTVASIGKISSVTNDALPFSDEARLFSNWRWFKFD